MYLINLENIEIDFLHSQVYYTLIRNDKLKFYNRFCDVRKNTYTTKLRNNYENSFIVVVSNYISITNCSSSRNDKVNTFEIDLVIWTNFTAQRICICYPSTFFDLANHHETASKEVENYKQLYNQLEQLINISDDVHILDKNSFYPFDIDFNLFYHSRYL